jgi:hypothetical protein
MVHAAAARGLLFLNDCARKLPLSMRQSPHRVGIKTNFG